jgi:hypothetical protein
VAFGPRHKQKRSEVIPPVRLTEEERRAVDWLTAQLSEEDGTEYSLSDTVRAALGELLAKRIEKADQAGRPVPEGVRRLLG